MTYLGIPCETCGCDTVLDDRGYCLWCLRKPGRLARQAEYKLRIRQPHAWRAARERRLGVAA